jgi:hypothetical protein
MSDNVNKVKNKSTFLARVLFGAFGMAVGLFIVFAISSLLFMGGEQADRLIGDHGLLIFATLYLVSLLIVLKKLSR